MPSPARVIAIEPLAPSKPAWGVACNGCGLCCLFEPCPLGMVISRRRRGACVALRWLETERRYRCGALAQPERVLGELLPRRLSPVAGRLAPALRRWAQRWIAPGIGCDSHLSATRIPP